MRSVNSDVLATFGLPFIRSFRVSEALPPQASKRSAKDLIVAILDSKQNSPAAAPCSRVAPRVTPAAAPQRAAAPDATGVPAAAPRSCAAPQRATAPEATSVPAAAPRSCAAPRASLAAAPWRAAAPDATGEFDPPPAALVAEPGGPEPAAALADNTSLNVLWAGGGRKSPRALALAGFEHGGAS